MKYKDIIKNNNENFLDYLRKKFNHQCSEKYNSIIIKRSNNMVKYIIHNHDETFEIQNKNNENKRDYLNLNTNYHSPKRKTI